ncbi:hypothetical protein Tdes44962_MAKER04867 [Teratosphaeria destructans]|uniref:Uncharacterized protein n=1 Tax=Teratosphaeria destructans TaxID=418781 RepID=A0A9W7SLX1_9PEZI|nr:hypothetical protein Tdes44962_MAKER04867 [Teratosphaeria destructans]
MAPHTLLLLLTPLTLATPTPPPQLQRPTPLTSTDLHPRILHKRTLGGVTLSTGPNFTGSETHVDLPVNECIDLNGYAGNTLSFQPDEGTECYLMQGKCNSELPYADLYNNSTDVGDLSGYGWIQECQSYMCFAALYF